jgi:hypothetical protein
VRLATRVAYEEPPNGAAIRARFPGLPAGVVFAYGDTIYVPGGEPRVGRLVVPAGAELPHPLVVHEEIHFDQQAAAGGPDAWWGRYLDDDAFRLGQEVEAYRAQLAAVPGRAERRRLLAAVVKDLAGPMYGRLVTKETARRLLGGHLR